MFNIIVTDTIAMHLIEKRHIDELHNLYIESQKTIKETIPDIDLIVKDKSKLIGLIQNWLDGFANGEIIYLLIRFKNKPCGLIGLEIDNYNHSANIALWMNPNYLRMRIAYSCAEKLIDLGFNEYNLERIELQTPTDNMAIIEGSKKLGFIEEGIKRKAYYINDNLKDMMISSLLKEEWIGSKVFKENLQYS